MPQKPGRLAAAALLAAGILLSGCGAGSEPGPRSLPPLTASAAAAATARADPVALPRVNPAGSHRSTRAIELAAASAAVRRYYQLLNGPAGATTATALGSLVTRHCRCRAVAALMRTAGRHHEHFVGRGHLTSLRAAYNSDREVQVIVTYNATATGLVRRNGSFVARAKPAHDVTEALFVDRVGGNWVISEILRVPDRH